MIIAVVGSRDAKNYDYDAFCAKIPKNATEIISGGAIGIDSYAKKYALEYGLPLREILPDYDSAPGKLAPLIRNEEIVRRADFVLAFWNGRSRGTRHVISLCMHSGTPFEIVRIV